jgi:hypothetical protein
LCRLQTITEDDLNAGMLAFLKSLNDGGEQPAAPEAQKKRGGGWWWSQ